MTSLLLSLALGVFPPASSAPFEVVAPFEPIQVQGVPVLVWSGTNYVVLWLDGRRSLDLPGAPLDVWAGSWTTAQPRIDGRLVSESSGTYREPRLAAESMGNVRAAWVRANASGGVVEHTRFPAQLFPHLPARSPISDTNTGVILGLKLAATPTATAVVTQRAKSIYVARRRPITGTQPLSTGPLRSLSLVPTTTGLYLHVVDDPGDLSGYQLLEPSGVQGVPPTMTGLGAAHVVGIASQPPSLMLIQTTSGEIKHQLTDAGRVSGNNTGQLPPLVLGVPMGAVVLFESDAGASLRLSTETASSVSGSNVPGVTPLALAGADPNLLMAVISNGQHQLQPVNRSGSVLLPAAAIPAFRAPTPQINATAGWSGVDDGFLLLWDQRDGGAWETRGAVVDSSGPQELGAVIAAQPSRSNPRLVVSPDAGALFVAFGPPANRNLFSLVGGSLQGQISADVLEEVQRGEQSTFTWSPTDGVARLPNVTGEQSETIARGCVRWWNGAFWYVPATPLVLRRVTESGMSSDTGLSLPMGAASLRRRCLTITRQGGFSITLASDAGLDVYAITPGKADLLARHALPLSEAPATTAAGDGVVVVAPLVADGQRSTLRFVYAAVGVSSHDDDINRDTQPVRNVSATTSPAGDVMVAWETFELDAGAWKVQSRLIRPPFPDAGELDAGAASDGGSIDAGSSDAGRPDAGASDAGPLDAGPLDAGPLDAGPLDAGPLDAGPRPVDAGVGDAGVTIDGGMEQPPVFVPVCGCSGTGTLPPLLLGLIVLLRRRRGVS